MFMGKTTHQQSSDDVLQALRAKAGLLPNQPRKRENDGITSTLTRLKDAGMMDAFVEWEKEETQNQLMLVASGEMDPSLLTSVVTTVDDKPLYAFLLGVFDERVQAAVKMQQAFRRLRRQCKDVGWPSDENPYHWIHFVDVRKQTGWSKEELYDEYGEPRERTDGGRAPKRKKEATGSEITAHAKYMDAIGNFKERYDGRMPFDGDMELIGKLRQEGNKIDLSLVSSFLAARWWKMRQARLAKKLDLNPLKAEFREGSVQYNELKRWMLGNGHGGVMLMHNPLVRDLKASLNFVPEDNQAKIMGLLGQFNNVLQFKQGKKMKMNRHVMGMYEWVMQDVAKAYREELEESRRWAVTPPEPPEGLDEEIMDLYEEVMGALSDDKQRICCLRKFGRRWLQAFEDSTWKRRRLIRTRSAGNLGLLGPAHIDPSKVQKIYPVVGEHPAVTAKEMGKPSNSAFRPHCMHVQLQFIVDKQVKRAERGRTLRPLHCLNTAWMGGVDWETVAAKATGRPLPGGVRAPPPPSDKELGDLIEDVFEGSEAERSEAGDDEDQEGEAKQQKAQEDLEEEEANYFKRVGSRLNRARVAKAKVPKLKQIPFDVDCYVDEVQDVMQELHLTGLHCRDLMDKMMIGARAPIMIPSLDAELTAQGCEAALRTLPVALENKRRRETRKEFGAEVAMFNEHAVVGSLGHAEVLAEVIEEQGITLPQRPLSAVLPSQLGKQVERGYANPHLLPDLTSDTESEGDEAEGTDGASLKGSVWGGTKTRGSSRAGPKSVAGTVKPARPAPSAKGDSLGALPTFKKESSINRLPSSQFSPTLRGRAPSVMGSKYASPINSKARMRHKATLGERLKKPEMTWEMLKQAWNQGGLASIQGQDGRCLPLQMEVGSWNGTIIRKSPQDLGIETKGSGGITTRTSSASELQTRASVISATGSIAPSAVPSDPEVAYYPNGLAAAKEMAVKKNKEIMLKVREAELKRRAAAGIRIDSSKSLYAGFLGIKGEQTQPIEPTIAEDEHEGEDGEGPNMQSWQEAAGTGENPEEQGDDLVEPPAPRVFESPTSDMLLLHRNEWWATVLADAMIMQQLSTQAIVQRLKGRNKWTTSELPVREKRRQEELKLLEAYVDRFHTMQTSMREHPVKVGAAAITETTPEEQRHMHQDWCSLFRSEMFVWLNQYLTRGTLPSTTTRPGNKVNEGHRDYDPMKRAQQHQEVWLQEQQTRISQQQQQQQQPKGALGLIAQGKRPPQPGDQAQPSAYSDAEAFQAAHQKMMEQANAQALFNSGKDAAEAAAAAFGTSIMYDSGSEDDELHCLPDAALLDPNNPLPPTRSHAKAAAAAAKPNTITTTAPQLAGAAATPGMGPAALASPKPAPATAAGLPDSDKQGLPMTYNTVFGRSRASSARGQQQQQQQPPVTPTPPAQDKPSLAIRPIGAITHTHNPASMSLAALGAQARMLQQPVPPSTARKSQDGLASRRTPLQRSRLGYKEGAEARASQEPPLELIKAILKRPTNDESCSPDNSEPPKSGSPVRAEPLSGTSSISPLSSPKHFADNSVFSSTVPSSNKPHVEPLVQGPTDVFPMMSVKGIGPRTSMTKTTPSKRDLLNAGGVPEEQFAKYAYVTEKEVQAALKEAKEQDAWMAVAQGRELVAGIALPRRAQHSLVPGAPDDITINELRDGSLPAAKPQGYLFLTARQQQQQAAARASRLQRVTGYESQNVSMAQRQGSIFHAVGENGEFTAKTLGLGGFRINAANAGLRLSLDSLGIRGKPTIPQIHTQLNPRGSLQLQRGSSLQPHEPSVPAMAVGGVRMGISRGLQGGGFRESPPSGVSASIDGGQLPISGRSNSTELAQVPSSTRASVGLAQLNLTNSRSAPLKEQARAMNGGPQGDFHTPGVGAGLRALMVPQGQSAEDLRRSENGGIAGMGISGVRAGSARGGAQPPSSKSNPRLPSLAVSSPQHK